MLAASIITLRETLEASLIVGIVLATLQFLRQEEYRIAVWLGVLAGVVGSLIVALFFRYTFGGFEGAAEEIYEGITMLFGAALLTWMILWMLGQRRTMKSEIQAKVQWHAERQSAWGIFLLVVVSVLREGVETVIFLQAAILHVGGVWHLVGGMVGIATAIILSYLLFRGIVLIPLRAFFTVTSVMLILFAAGLVAHGIHEFEEAGLVPALIKHLWDLNPAIATEGVFPLFHEEGAIGSLLRGLLGYNASPSLIEVMSYLAYLTGIGALWAWMERRSTR